jgi:hypothetical protein
MDLENWQEATFQEIIASRNTHWILQMPRRYGKTHLLDRLFTYYNAKGKEIHIINQANDDYLLSMLIRWYTNVYDATNVVFLIEGNYKWDPHDVIIPKGGMIVVAQSNNEDYRQKDREYRVLHY